MSATLTVDSVVGRGSLFRLCLPAVPLEDAGGGEAEKVAAEATRV